jgi:signal peptide peptidase SppA
MGLGQAVPFFHRRRRALRTLRGLARRLRSGAMSKFLRWLRPGPVVSVVRLEGVIGGSMRFGTAPLTDAGLAALLEAAFRRGRPKAVAFLLNSPGGSPAQSSLIAARIRRLAEEKGIPVFAFCEDIAASGGYWLATAADEIWIDRNSIVGSIGVISASFGFHELLAKAGVERRVHTAGEDKSLLDPFRPERPEDVARLKRIQAQVHAHFIEQVRARRGAKLKGDDLFTGEFWVGEAAVATGLVDGIGHLVPKLKERFGEDVRFRVLQPRRPLLRRFGVPSVGEVLAEVEARLEERGVWARFGLSGR